MARHTEIYIYILIKYGKWHLINLHNAVMPTATSFNRVARPTQRRLPFYLFDSLLDSQMEIFLATSTHTSSAVTINNKMQRIEE